MPKSKKPSLDIAAENKEQFVRENYLVKESDSGNTPINRKRIAIGSMLFILLLCLVFVFYWTYFYAPTTQEVSEQLQATPIIKNSPAPSFSLYPATPTPRSVLSKYDEYKEIYPDIVGWISIDNIKVDYPVVQSSNPLDPFKYLVRGPDAKDSKYGSIFLDVRNSIDASDYNTIIYGHNMKDGSMFGQLNMYMRKSFYDDHIIIRYDTLYQELEWEVFNVFETTTDFYYIETYFDSDKAFLSLMEQCIYKSYYNNNQTVISPEDRILTLSTCTNGADNERLVLQARLITPLAGMDEDSEKEIPSATP